MIRKYHNQKLQINPWHHKEEPYNNHKTPGRQTKQSNQLPIPHQDDSKTRVHIKSRTTKHRTITDSHNDALEWKAAYATGGGGGGDLNAF